MPDLISQQTILNSQTDLLSKDTVRSLLEVVKGGNRQVSKSQATHS